MNKFEFVLNSNDTAFIYVPFGSSPYEDNGIRPWKLNPVAVNVPFVTKENCEFNDKVVWGQTRVYE